METSYNKRTSFDHVRFLKDVLAYERTLPRVHTDLSIAGRIARETKQDKKAIKYAFERNYIVSLEMVLKLAGWAGLYLDEYRRE